MKLDVKKLINIDMFIIVVSIILSFIEQSIGVIILTIYCIVKFYQLRGVIFAFVANTKYHAGRINKALDYYKYSATIPNAKPKYISMYIYLELKCGSYEKAEETLNEILKKRKFIGEDLFSVEMLRALVEWKKGELDSCIKILDNIYKQDFKNTTLFETLGYALISKGDLNKALEFNTEALNFNEESVIIKANLGEIYYKLGEKEKSEEMLKPLTEQNIQFAEPYYYLALILNEKGDKDTAVSLLEQSLKFPESILTNLTKDDICNVLDSIEA